MFNKFLWLSSWVFWWWDWRLRIRLRSKRASSLAAVGPYRKHLEVSPHLLPDLMANAGCRFMRAREVDGGDTCEYVAPASVCVAALCGGQPRRGVGAVLAELPLVLGEVADQEVF